MRYVVVGLLVICLALLGLLWYESRGDPDPVPTAAEAPARTTKPAKKAPLGRINPVVPPKSAPVSADKPARDPRKFTHPPSLAPRGRGGAFDSRREPRVALTVGRRARQALDQGNYDLALQFAEEDLASNPHRRRPRVIAAIASCATGKSDKAAEHAKSLRRGPYRRVARRCKDEFNVELPEYTDPDEP